MSALPRVKFPYRVKWILQAHCPSARKSQPGPVLVLMLSNELLICGASEHFKNYLLFCFWFPEISRMKIRACVFTGLSEWATGLWRDAWVLTTLPNYDSSVRAAHHPSANWETRILPQKEKSKVTGGCKLEQENQLPHPPSHQSWRRTLGHPWHRLGWLLWMYPARGTLIHILLHLRREKNRPSINNINHGSPKLAGVLPTPK